MYLQINARTIFWTAAVPLGPLEAGISSAGTGWTLYILGHLPPVATHIADNEMTCSRLCNITMEATTPSLETDVLCTTVVEAIAEHTNTDPLSMTPLATVVDPEALEAVVNSGPAVQVTFDYDDLTVVVGGDGTVSVDGEEYDETAVTEGQ